MEFGHKQTNKQTERHTHVCVNRQTNKLKDIRELTAAAPLPLPAFSVALGCADGLGETARLLLGGATGGRVLVPIEHCDNVRGLSDVFSAATTSILTITILNR